MLHTDFQQVFVDAANEVLEAMFFTVIEDENAEECPPGRVSAQLQFLGSPSGVFGVQMPADTSRLMAANFLGCEEVSEGQVAEVICELSNMLCGSVLSRVKQDAAFELLHPHIEATETDWKERNDAVGYTFGLGEGRMTMWMAIEDCISAQHPA